MRIFRLLVGGTLLATSAPALAQTSDDPAQAGPAATDPEGAEEDAPELDAIVVTALRRETNLQRTPISISVMSAENLADRHVQSLMDLSDGSIPGLRVATFEARQSALTIGIRGIVPLDANQPAREQGVGVYIDGVYLGRQHGLGAALLDVERIEVLKGPQGTLFGRNTEGGAVNMVTRHPTGEFGMRATFGVGNFNAYNGETHIDFPSLANVSFKLDAVVQHQDATTGNPLPGQTGWNFYNRRGLRLSARWRPSSGLTADLAYDVGRDENSPYYSQLLNYNPLGLTVGPASGTLPAGQIRPLPPIVQVEGGQRMGEADIGVPQQPSVDRTQGVSLHLRWEAAPWLELRSISAWREVDVEQWDNSGGAHRVPAFAANGNFSRYSLSDLRQHQYSQELQAVGSIAQLDYTFGIYYFYERAQEEAATPSTNRWNAAGTGSTINDPTPTIRGSRSLDRGSFAHARSYAAYGQATWTPPILDDMLHVTLGGRYTHDDKDGRLYIVNNAPTSFTFEQVNSRFDPMATIAFDPTPEIEVYARFATGYRAGGASSRSLTYRAFGPEEVTSYEIGAKTQWFDRRLRLNVAGFRMDRTGSQIDFALTTPTGPNTTRNTIETVNAPGTTRIWGIEAEATARLTDNLTISGAYAYTHTRIPPTVNPFNNLLQPVFIVFTPRNTVSGAIDYSVPAGDVTIRAHLDGNYADATQTFDYSAVTNDSSFIVNGRLSIADIGIGGGNRLALSLWARNLLDEEHVYRRDPQNRATLGDYGNFNAPRTFGIEASLVF